MQYFEAVKEGRVRVQVAIDILQSVAGPCYPMLFLKIGVMNWTPVGEESPYSVVPGKNSTAAVALCDAEGNTKTMTPWISLGQAEEYAKALSAKGLAKYDGEVKLPI